MRFISQRSGFTIVELLVVIVIIAILAAVSIVAYNGVQTRAENTKTLSGLGQLGKALQLYKNDNGRYPLVKAPGTSSSFTFVCVSSSDPSNKCGKVGGSDNSCAGVGQGAGSSIFEAAIKTVMSSVPEVSNLDMQCDNIQVRGALYYVHLFDATASDQNAYVLYFLKGNEQCRAPAGAKVATQQLMGGGTTRCTVQFMA